MNKLITLGAAMSLSALLFTAGCAKKTEETTTGEKPSTTEAPPTPIDQATVATINGKVLFTGEKQAPKSINMSAEPVCKQSHTGNVYFEDVVVNDNGTLQNVFVYVKDGLGNRTFETPKTPATLDQHGCLYSPHVVALQAGQDLKILNSDNTNHNIHPMPTNNREWNQSMAPKQEPLMRNFPREEIMIPVKCNIHPWMKSYIGVLKHPFFAVTGKDGSYEIKGLPPGTYTIEAWHEKYKTQTQQVTVGPKESKSIDFTYKSDSGAASAGGAG